MGRVRPALHFESPASPLQVPGLILIFFFFVGRGLGIFGVWGLGLGFGV